MVRCRHHDRIYLLLFLEHFAVVPVPSCLGKLIENGRRVGRVHVAKSHDVFAAQVLKVFRALAAETDSRNVQFFIRSGGALEAEDVAGNDLKGRGRGGRAAQEPAPGNPDG